ncbi:CDP-glycerol glycerophosphotransferase family protein [Nocardioides agariphilus]|uniref:CDP-glycerol glycerophosphotransferase family protein n=1 Tax=Nocardioides agariphilus TaxID=433664 RepID=A0A930VQT6_9ACTN|nr:CDP-glycerol glycerophosphotransferase family protein [Nocardioides agariphilus]MBF4769176.1 CDP-glycerol glycerophosphotransferase family protein [Nocardioides agariphilus]
MTATSTSSATAGSGAMSGAEFARSWSLFVRAWADAHAISHRRSADLVARALANGLEPAPAGDVGPVKAEVERSCAIAVLRGHGGFDDERYLESHPSVAERGMDPVRHFHEHGWKQLVNPCHEFDTWWYWVEYLDPTVEDVDPYLHYVLAGRFAGHLPTPARRETRPATSYPTGTDIRRVCLFAAYDVDGVVDDYVVAYLTELSRHCDVYYLADSHVDKAELAKLDGITTGAWAIRHGMYDFGSFSLLARDLVGWSRIEEYDELVLANDSAYLLKPLDEMFERMDRRACDWWGLQATKRPFREERGFSRPVPLEQAKRHMVGEPEMLPLDHLHLSSYLMVFRKPVVLDPGFRRRLDTVVRQQRKIAVILKYEVGLSRYLMSAGFDFETFVDDLYPFHPLYTEDYFALLRNGFPLLKRNLITENPRKACDVRDWKRRVTDVVPDAPVEMLERNLLRVAADDTLQRSFSVRVAADGTPTVPPMLDAAELRAEDRRTPTFDHWWAFPVCAFDHTFAGNERAVFEEVKDDPSIKKIVLTRSRRVEVAGENVVVVPLFSPEGQYYALRAGQVFVKHAAGINLPFGLSPNRRNFINLWHGIPLKRFGFAGLDLQGRVRRALGREHGACRAVIASSRLDALAMQAALHPLTLDHMWVTGLPRNDFIVREEEQLPADLRAALERLRVEVAGRSLVLFLPTFKQDQFDAYYEFDQAEIAWLKDWCVRHNAVIGVREHMADTARTYSEMLAPLDPIDLSSRRYPDLEVLYRAADALVTDYSSCIVDFLLTGRQVISFAYDYERYAQEERGLFYHLDDVLPGPVCRDFAQLSTALDSVFDEQTPEQRAEYEWRRRLFFDHLDDRAASRVVDNVKRLYVGPDEARG